MQRGTRTDTKLNKARKKRVKAISLGRRKVRTAILKNASIHVPHNYLIKKVAPTHTPTPPWPRALHDRSRMLLFRDLDPLRNQTPATPTDWTLISTLRKNSRAAPSITRCHEGKIRPVEKSGRYKQHVHMNQTRHQNRLALHHGGVRAIVIDCEVVFFLFSPNTLSASGLP